MERYLREYARIQAVPHISNLPDVLLTKESTELMGHLEHARSLIDWKHGITYSRPGENKLPTCTVTEPP
jgi:hypothetical protein